MTINFLPWREKLNKRRKRRFLIDSACIVIFIIFFSIIWQINCYSDLDFQKKQQGFLEKKIDSISNLYFSILDARKNKEFFKKNNISKKEIFFVLDQIAEKMPPEIYLTSILKKENKLYVNGKSISRVKVEDFLKQMRKCSDSPKEIRTLKNEDELQKINFEVVYLLATASNFSKNFMK